MDARPYVDFSSVKPEHRAIDDRLANWGRWNRSSGGGSVSPMFRLYRAPEHWERALTANPVDQADARRIQWAMRFMPIPARLALSWAYIYGYTSPAKTAKKLEVSLAGLRDLVEGGRVALIEAKA